jgi:DMSO/TMAO reductase YedYZ molybdopterin-dependent catalytic subunit
LQVGSEMMLSRRGLLKSSAIAAGLLFAGGDPAAWAKHSPDEKNDPFLGGKKLGVIDFSEELPIEMGTTQGSELDGRLYTDLSTLTPEAPVTPTQSFYLRTGASNLLPEDGMWTFRLGGMVRQPVEITKERLKIMARPLGVHLMECAGNTRAFHFGMMSAADWTGVPVSELLNLIQAEPGATRVLVSGFDRYQAESATSIPGASWIFGMDELISSRAFLATQMNGAPLTRDHGAPVRLVVPGWYGCTCIKWVNEIALIGDDADATSQMQEYSARTQQTGTPQRAKDYRPAAIEYAATPIRIERWLVDGQIKFRVVGLLWGGSLPVKTLEIRFNPEEEYVPVDYMMPARDDSWSFWTRTWMPKVAGTYLIRLRVKDPVAPSKRLGSGYYLRSVEIDEGDL